MSDSPVLDRRTFLRGAASVTAVTAAGLLVAGKASATNLYNLQNDWGWCSLCSEIYYAGTSFKGQGVCPKQPGDGHATPGWNYSMIHNQGTTGGLPGTPGYQSGWYWCKHCFSLYWHGTNPGGCCPAEYSPDNGSHNPGASFNYAVPVNISGSSYQSGWNYCKSCGCLYWSGAAGKDGGFCWVNSNQLGGQAAHSHGSSWPYELIH